jgi:hypothetical protein
MSSFEFLHIYEHNALTCTWKTFHVSMGYPCVEAMSCFFALLAIFLDDIFQFFETLLGIHLYYNCPWMIYLQRFRHVLLISLLLATSFWHPKRKRTCTIPIINLHGWCNHMQCLDIAHHIKIHVDERIVVVVASIHAVGGIVILLSLTLSLTLTLTSSLFQYCIVLV